MELEISSRWALAVDLGSNPSLVLTGRLVLSKAEPLSCAMGTGLPVSWSCSSSCPTILTHTQRRPPKGTQRPGRHPSCQELPSDHFRR